MTQLIAMSILILAMLVALVGLWRRTSVKMREMA